MRVLVVDDNAVNRRVLLLQLTQCGVEAASAASAVEALELLRLRAASNRPFDAVLTDYGMPDSNGAELGRIIRQDAALRATRLILLTSSGQLGDAPMFASIGFAGHLLKPVGRHDLVDCLKLVASKPAETWHLQSQPMVTQSQIRLQNTQTIGRILLAEDNLVNQKVARHMLEKLNYAVDVVGNGREAVGAWRNGVYDVILMDCQMPELDGYEATREIRRLECGSRRIPIVALTADAMKDADQACLDAGMDDYLTNPIDRQKLEATLRFHLTKVSTDTDESIPLNAVPTGYG